MLSGEERERLREVISRGKAKAKSILKARILLKAVQGWRMERSAKRSTPTFRWWLAFAKRW